jgi:hypothetical protein
MKRTFKYALSAVLATALAVPALAQDNFPDVPDHHWAFEALQRMRSQGLLVGYPDGLFRGGRPASRYEMAVAIHATYQHLLGLTRGLETRLAAVEGRPVGTPTDVTDLRQQIAALQKDVAAMRGQSDAIADLRRMAGAFEKELASIGVDVEAMRRDLGDLADRVTRLEARRAPVDISGDVNLVVLGGYSRDNEFGITVDGRPTGVGRRDYGGAPVGVHRDLSVFHEGSLSLTSTNEAGPRWQATFVSGNMVGDNGFYNQSRVAPTGFSPVSGAPVGGRNQFLESNQEFYVQNFEVHFDTGIAGLGFNARVGRVGYAISPYIFQRPDNSPYYANDRWDNGRWNFDGAILGTNIGGARLNVLFGRNSSARFNNGDLMQPMRAGSDMAPLFPGGERPRGLPMGVKQIDQSLGAHLNVPLGGTGVLNLAYLWLDSNDTTAVAGGDASNGVQVFGGDARFGIGGIGLEAGFSKSDVVYNNTRVISDDNEAWYAQANFNVARVGLNVGYRSIDPLFAAPGDWGRIGIWWNPTDIEGIYGGAHFNLTPNLRVSARGERYEGRATASSGLGSDDTIERYVVGLEYKLAARYDLALGLEEVRWDLAARDGFAGGQPRERWWNIGFGFDLAQNARLRFLWQISDYDARGTDGFGPFLNPVGASPTTSARGGLITTQLSVKF